MKWQSGSKIEAETQIADTYQLPDIYFQGDPDYSKYWNEVEKHPDKHTALDIWDGLKRLNNENTILHTFKSFLTGAKVTNPKAMPPMLLQKLRLKRRRKIAKNQRQVSGELSTSLSLLEVSLEVTLDEHLLGFSNQVIPMGKILLWYD